MSGDSSIGIGIGLALKSYGRAFRGLLNQYPGAAAAYSLRKLSGAVSNVVRVRRSFDDAEQDFTAAQVDNGTLVNFANNGTSALYNERMYFDGVDDSVSLASRVDFGTGNFTFSFNFLGEGFAIGDSAVRWLANITSTSVTIRAFNTATLYTINWDTPITIFQDHSLSISRSGNTISATLDGILQASTATCASIDTFSTNRIGNVAANWFSGILYDINLNNQASYQGYGNTNADWLDQIGSNNGTVNGSPALYSGQGFDGFVATEYDQSGAVLRDGTQSTTTNQPQIVSNGALVTDGNGNISTIWDGLNDDLDVAAGFAGLTAANVYAVTDNAGVVTLDTLTAQDISADTNLTTILTGITYDKVTAVIIYPDNTNQSAIQSEINTLFGI